MTQRRDFIKKSILGTAGITIGGMGFSAKSYASIMGANDRFRIAVCGVNGRGKSHINGFGKLDNVEIAYLVDPDKKILDERVNLVKDEIASSSAVKGVTDVRTVLDDKNIDAISCATPNHWHSLMVIWAAQAQKHCYVEKPASHDIYEGRVALAAAEKYGIVVQHGTQRRSSDDWAKQVSDIRSGKYGKMLVSHGFACKPREGIGFEPPSTPPPSLDWNLWKGPAVVNNFHKNLVHYNWHWFWPVGNGELNNQGTHQLDVAYWALDSEVENTHPVRVMAIGGRFKWGDQGETPNTMFALAEFSNGQYVFFNVRNVNHEGYQREVTNRFYFEDGGKLWDGEYISSNGSQARNVPIKEVKITPGGNWQSFITACKANDPYMANGTMYDAHYSCTLGHLMNISYRLGEKVPFNARAGRFGDNELAFQEFMKIHDIASDGMGVPQDQAEYIVGPWLRFDGEAEHFVGDYSTEANRLLRDPRNAGFDIPSPESV
ncbi:Gfo/Idh/MocA family protein [Maribellus maritimus]|uniref:Gfo/Idh/MocA family protein n=1 Tax=Maribellus maritimus TaxID=2870838 RepID=UPI001EEA1E4C|nr:Gfo/Idh/MocA family oxidoreductase [Maribellus maritimus]MCG6189187.1 Gfo/Idh/MocA family oxidoreductase [Maribellus maritimus]